MELRPGAMISARLRLVRPVGSGGMGSVWVAYHEKLKSEVAVKFIEGAGKNNPQALARFEREAEIAAKLKNPHVAQMYDHGALGDGTPYIVMELLEGESLQERLRGGPLSLHETSLIVSQAAQALGKAHKLGIVHRDVKPGNLFLIDTDYELFVKLLDFGIAKSPVVAADHELTRTGNLLGSPLYMSPEQFTEVKSVDHRADLWSLAVVAYRCLAAMPPFVGEALGNVVMAVMHRQYTPITEACPQLPSSLDAWFAKAFHHNIADRYQSARELATSFVAIVRGVAQPGQLRPPLPSITEMTHAALEQRTPPKEGKTADLPGEWRASAPQGGDATLKLGGDNELRLGAEAATLAPAATTVVEGRGKARIGMLIATAALLLASGVGGYVALGARGETKGEPRVEGQLTDGAEKDAHQVVTAPPAKAPVSPVRGRATAEASSGTTSEVAPIASTEKSGPAAAPDGAGNGSRAADSTPRPATKPPSPTPTPARPSPKPPMRPGVLGPGF